MAAERGAPVLSGTAAAAMTRSARAQVGRSGGRSARRHACQHCSWGKGAHHRVARTADPPCRPSCHWLPSWPASSCSTETEGAPCWETYRTRGRARYARRPGVGHVSTEAALAVRGNAGDALGPACAGGSSRHACERGARSLRNCCSKDAKARGNDALARRVATQAVVCRAPVSVLGSVCTRRDARLPNAVQAKRRARCSPRAAPRCASALVRAQRLDEAAVVKLDDVNNLRRRSSWRKL